MERGTGVDSERSGYGEVVDVAGPGDNLVSIRPFFWYFCSYCSRLRCVKNFAFVYPALLFHL
jgi:hypothetical protein